MRKCPRCAEVISDNAAKCRRCGASLSARREAAGVKGIQTELDDIGRQLDADLASALGSVEAGLDMAARRPAPARSAPVSVGRSPAAAPDGARGLVHEHEWQSLFEPQEAQVRQAAEFVMSSPLISENPVWSARIESVTFAYLGDDPTVNAFASDGPFPLPDGETIETPVIAFLGGLAAAIRLAAAALSLHVRCHQGVIRRPPNWSIEETLRQMGQAIEQSGQFHVQQSPAIIGEAIGFAAASGDERFVSLARDFSAAMEMAVVAHEAGHIAYCHTLGPDLSTAARLNMERDADSFAASLLGVSPFRRYLFLGQVFTDLIFAWAQQADEAVHRDGERTGGEITHPTAYERFLNTLRSHGDAAKEAEQEFGLDAETLNGLFPQAWDR